MLIFRFSAQIQALIDQMVNGVDKRSSVYALGDYFIEGIHSGFVNCISKFDEVKGLKNLI